MKRTRRTHSWCLRPDNRQLRYTPSPITFSTGPGDGKVAGNRTARETEIEREREREREGGCETGSARVRQFKVSVRGTQSRAERSGVEEEGGRRDPSQTGSSCLTCQWRYSHGPPLCCWPPRLPPPPPSTPPPPFPLQLFSLTASKLSCTAPRVALASVNTVCVSGFPPCCRSSLWPRTAPSHLCNAGKRVRWKVVCHKGECGTLETAAQQAARTILFYVVLTFSTYVFTYEDIFLPFFFFLTDYLYTWLK